MATRMSRRAQRRGMSMVELLVIGSIGLMTVAVIVGLVAAAWRQDTWTGGRLDAIAAVGTTLDTLRQDLFYANAGQTDPEARVMALRIQKAGASGPEVAVYSWAGAGKSLTRNGKPLGFARPDGFGVKVEEDTAVFEMTIPSSALPGRPPHETRLSVPLVIPDAYWAEKLDYWAPSTN